MLQINGKTFMNLQEAVQWLLDNNCIPFQCTANYQANTEIGLGTIVNPTPAKVRIGSLIFFADSKVSTVIGLTENGFICSDEYNDLVDDVVYVSNVQLNASGHLIVTLSNGTDIDAGLIKQVTDFSINASQHLIVSYNNGTSTDLGAIFSGDINISGTFTATHAKIFENLEDANDHNRFLVGDIDLTVNAPAGMTKTFGKWALSGNHLMLVLGCEFADETPIVNGTAFAKAILPTWIGNQIANLFSVAVDSKTFQLRGSDWSSQDVTVFLQKASVNNFYFDFGSNVTVSGTKYARFVFDLLIAE